MIILFCILLLLKKHIFLSKQLKGLEREFKVVAQCNKLDQNKWQNLDVSSWRKVKKFHQWMQIDGVHDAYNLEEISFLLFLHLSYKKFLFKNE